MRERERHIAARLLAELTRFNTERRQLLGIQTVASRDAFVEQLIESVRRVEYVRTIGSRDISAKRADPSSSLFDPLKAALLHDRQVHSDEAFWLVFLATHFGRHRSAGWETVRAVYGALGHEHHWDWARMSADPSAFRDWLEAHQAEIPRRFGNHRKYESLDARSAQGTGAVIQSYVEWVAPPRTHLALINDIAANAGPAPHDLFDALYESMNKVARFGRTARFDYLTMLGKLGLANIEPGRPYVDGATGPKTGACLLFTGRSKARVSATDLDIWVAELGRDLQLRMQVMEDALCNWQKSPAEFRRFRG